VNRYQKGKPNLDFTEARDSGWQWYHLDDMQFAYNDAVRTDTVTDSSKELHSRVLHIEWPGRVSVMQRLPDCLLWFSEGVQGKRKDCCSCLKCCNWSLIDNLAGPMLFFVSYCFLPLKFTSGTVSAVLT